MAGERTKLHLETDRVRNCCRLGSRSRSSSQYREQGGDDSRHSLHAHGILT